MIMMLRCEMAKQTLASIVQADSEVLRKKVTCSPTL